MQKYGSFQKIKLIIKSYFSCTKFQLKLFSKMFKVLKDNVYIWCGTLQELWVNELNVQRDKLGKIKSSKSLMKTQTDGFYSLWSLLQKHLKKKKKKKEWVEKNWSKLWYIRDLFLNFSVFGRSWRRCKCLHKNAWLKRTQSSFQPLGHPPLLPSSCPYSPASSWKRSSFIFHGLVWSGDSGMLWLGSPSHRLGEKVWCDRGLESMAELGVKQFGNLVSLVTASIGY